jgi:tetratricopeptide (TPR) repeat protein
MVLRHVDRHRSAVNGIPISKDDIRAHLLRAAASKLKQLESLPAPNTFENRVLAVGLRVRLLNAQVQRDAGEEMFNRFAKEQLANASEKSSKAKTLLYLGGVANSAGYGAHAEDLYRQLLKLDSKSYVLLVNLFTGQKKYNEAVHVCLDAAKVRPAREIATLLTQILSFSGPDPELARLSQPIISDALKTSHDDIGLLMSAAVQQTTASNYDDAIALFRKILQLQKDHVLALNNLATLLAERPNELAEARACVDRAIAISGRNPALLDTLGTIEIRAEKPGPAVAALEEAIAGGDRDPRYYFHLAAAYQLAKRGSDAQKAFTKAEQFGLEESILTIGDRELLRTVKQQLVATANIR